jgi:glycosyltransferase involved in cell wall biosynthesis
MLDNEFPPLGGGMGTVNRALLERFASWPELEVDLITSALGGQRETELFAERISIIKVPVWNRNLHHSTNRELITYAVQALPLAVRRHRTFPYDFCLAWSTVPAGGLALALHRLTALPYLVWVTGPDIPGFERRYRRIYPLLTPAIRGIWRDAAFVIAKCDDEIEMIHAVDSSVEVTLVPNGVDLDIFRPGPPVPDDGPLHVLCTARLIERKGQHHLIQAIKRLTDDGVDVTLSLVGTGDGLKANQALARELRVQERVHFLGYVPREEIAEHYAAAHVFVLPSYNEGMSLATLEAMAAGLPVIVTRDGTAELVDEGVNGLTFDWADVDALAAHLWRLANDRALVRRMGIASCVRAETFSWDGIAQRWADLFARLVQNPPQCFSVAEP